MRTLLKTAIRLKGQRNALLLDRATQQPRHTQSRLLLDILAANRKTSYGRKHAFASIDDPDAFRKAVPINTFTDLSPYVEQMKSGEPNVLTSVSPLMFNLTSGTTDKPKHIPVTPKGMLQTSSLSTQWLYRATQDHPSLLNHSIFCIAGRSVEGYTQSGIPFGSASGAIYRNQPRILHRSFVLPILLSEIRDYTLRYYVMMRIAMEKDISLVATPNPTTLIKLAETGIRHQDMIVESICKGNLLTTWPADICDEDKRIIEAVNRTLKPNRSTGAFLRQIIDRYGRLLPFARWKNLKLVLIQAKLE